jgi:hypothetical protein
MAGNLYKVSKNTFGSPGALDYQTFGQYGIDPSGKNPLAPMVRQIAGQDYTAAVDRGAFNRGLEPQYQQQLQNLLSSLNVSTDTMSNAANTRILANSQRIKGKLRKRGSSQGIVSGMGNGVDLAAAGQMNASDAQIFDPNARTGRILQGLTALSGAQSNNPYSSNILRGFEAQSQHRQQNLQESQAEGPGLFGTAVGLAGSLAGGGAFNGLFKGLK